MACRLLGAKPLSEPMLAWNIVNWTFNEILIGIQTFSFTKMHLKMASEKWRLFRLSLNVLTLYVQQAMARSQWPILPNHSDGIWCRKHYQYNDITWASWHDGISNNQKIDCLFNSFFMLTSKTHQSCPLLKLCEEIYWWPVDFPHKGSVMRKVVPCHNAIMCSMKSVMPECSNMLKGNLLNLVDITVPADGLAHRHSGDWSLGACCRCIGLVFIG